MQKRDGKRRSDISEGETIDLKKIEEMQHQPTQKKGEGRGMGGEEGGNQRF